MTTGRMATAVSLVLVHAAVLAQTGLEPDKNCPLKEGVLKQQISPGRVTSMTVKNKGNKDCKGAGDCTNNVEVQSFIRDNKEPACCTRVEWASLTSVKKNKKAVFKWGLVSVDGKPYVFNPDGIYIIQPPVPTPGDLGPLKLSSKDTVAKIKSVNGYLVTFNYGVSVSLNLGGGKYLACDRNDPVIVNQGD